jgi:hypothetical protein
MIPRPRPLDDVVRVDPARLAWLEALATVSAHTLAIEGPSPAVLRTSGFARTAVLADPVHHEIWRWELTLARHLDRAVIDPVDPARTPTPHQARRTP